MYNIGIDLGGTNIKTGVVDNDFNIIATSNLKTNLPRSAEEIADSIAQGVRLACKNANITFDEVKNIGIGTPGAANRKTGVVLYSNNLGFDHTDLGGMLKQRLGKTVLIENDANAAAYGEVLAGAGKGYQNVVVITLGTGVGGGVIIDGKIYSSFNFCGAELGHTVIEKDGRACSCGRKGCFEAYSSATALIAMTKEAMDSNKNSKMWEIVGSQGKVNGKTAFDGMRMGDKTSEKVVEKYLSYLGTGLVNMVNTFQPEVLLIGGGICKEGETITKPLEKIIADESYCIDPEQSTKLDVAKLGNDAGIIGAAFLHEID